MTIAGGISFVALYYGFKAKGGPVGVGNAVARAMIVNLILIHVLGRVLVLGVLGHQRGIPGGG